MLTIFTRSAALAFTVFTVIGCGGSRSNDPVQPTQASLEKSLQQVVDERIIPAVQEFETQVLAYGAAATGFCALQDEAALQTLQNGWKSLAQSWYRLLPYNFGPLKNDLVFPNFMFIDSYRLRGTHYLATVAEEIARIIEADGPVEADYFENLSFQKGGLLALEVLSFQSEDGVQDNEEILFSYVVAAKRCDLLLGHASRLSERAGELREGWLQSFSDTGVAYRQLFLSDNLPDDTPNLTALLGAAQEYLDYLKQREVVDNVATLSGNAWSLVNASIIEIKTMLYGNTQDQFNFIAVMSSAGRDQEAAVVSDNLEFIFNSIQQQNSADFGVGVSLLDGNFKREIPNGLDVDLGITFTDGD